MATLSEDKVAKLRQALKDYESGKISGQLFDSAYEQEKVKVRQRALLLLDQRPRSQHEVIERLSRADFPQPVIKDVVEDLVRVGLLDDLIFAKEWVRQRHQFKKKSAAALEQELKLKGIGPTLRRQALEQVTADSEQSKAEELAVRKASKLKQVPKDKQDYDKALRRIVGVVARRGFNSGMAFSVAKTALDERCHELESA